MVTKKQVPGVQTLSKKERQEKLENGWVQVVVLFEVVGNPQEHVEKTMETFLEDIRADDGIIALREEKEEVLPVGEGEPLFSAVAEVEYLVYGLEKLTWFAFNFVPASIEIKAPAELTLRDKDFSDWLNDLLAKLHEVNEAYHALRGEHHELVKSMNAAIRNGILLAVGSSSLDAKSIAQKVGMTESSVSSFLKAMIKEGRLVLDGKKYRRA